MKVRVDSQKIKKKLTSFVFFVAKNAFLTFLFLLLISFLTVCFLYFDFQKKLSQIKEPQQTFNLDQIKKAAQIVEKRLKDFNLK